MQRLIRLIFIFTILSALLIIVPSFLSDRFILYSLIKNGDVLDIFTPFILIPLYWLLFQIHPAYSLKQKEILAFILFAIFWIQGQGMHLAANSIGHLVKLENSTNIQAITYFYDELLSHYLWHIGTIGLSVLLIYRQWQNPFFKQTSNLKLELAAGIINGLVFFIDIIESKTTILGIPFILGVILFTLIQDKKHLTQQPILTFFFVSSSFAGLLFLGWGLYWGGLPEFSQVGIID